MVSDSDAIVADDRALNQHLHIGEADDLTPIISTLDLLDRMVASGAVTPENRSNYITRLRRSGYFFVPVEEADLKRLLKSTSVSDGTIIESAELKAIRESCLRIRMSSWIQLPKEAPWLDSLLRTYARVLKSMWEDEDDVASAAARSDWILDQFDFCGWAHAVNVAERSNVIRDAQCQQILMLLSAPAKASDEAKREYWNWLDGACQRV